MADQKDFQEKLVRYQILEGRVKALLQRREMLIAKMIEIENTLTSVEDVEKNKGCEILLPLGSNVHIPGTLKDVKKMIVEIGADVALEKDVVDAKKILGERKDIMNNGLQSIEKEITNITNEMLRIEQEIAALMGRTKNTDTSAG
jgi:prefoldin alpha subunit